MEQVNSSDKRKAGRPAGRQALRDLLKRLDDDDAADENPARAAGVHSVADARAAREEKFARLAEARSSSDHGTLAVPNCQSQPDRFMLPLVRIGSDLQQRLLHAATSFYDAKTAVCNSFKSVFQHLFRKRRMVSNLTSEASALQLTATG